VVDLLQAGGRLLPIVAAEISMARAGGEDEVVVSDPALVIDHNLTPGSVHAGDPAELDARVRLVGQDRADRPGDVGGRECCRRHLVQQRLEQVVVAPVDQDQVHRCLAQRPGRGQATEAHAYDHHARPISSHRLPFPTLGSARAGAHARRPVARAQTHACDGKRIGRRRPRLKSYLAIEPIAAGYADEEYPPWS
jgi:hypothetical protein